MNDRVQNAPNAKSKETPAIQVDPRGVQPLLKWPGGKRALVGSILPSVPKEFGRYFEPFLGGGALFFAISPLRATLSDANADLIETYKVVRDRPNELIQLLRKLHNSKNQYYKIRANRPEGPTERAARFIYLCTLAFNGIHRYNLKGEFNVPYGFKTHIDVCDEERIIACSARLKGSSLVAGDLAEHGQVVRLHRWMRVFTNHYWIASGRWNLHKAPKLVRFCRSRRIGNL